MSNPRVIREDPGEPSVDQPRVLAELTATHGAYLLGLARRLCRARLDPDDLLQDVFEKTLRSPVPDGANARAWLTRVMHNQFIDKLRRHEARREDLVAEPVERGGGDAKAWWENLTAADVQVELAQLPLDQQRTFELFAFDGKSYDEIARELGIAKATVGTRILRARQRLRELLERREVHDG